MSKEQPIYLKALHALRNREGLFRVLVFSLVTVLFWIGFSIYFSQQKTKVSIDILKHTEPLNPNINKETLQDLATRKMYTEDELKSFPIYERVVDKDKKSRLILAGSEPEDGETVTSSEKVASGSAIIPLIKSNPAPTASAAATPATSETPISTGSAGI